MSRIRTNSASLALLVGQVDAATGVHSTGNIAQLHRVTSLGHEWNDNKQDVQVYGATAPIGRERINPPDVSMDFSYYVADFENEKNLGFVVDGVTSALGNILAKTTDVKNYFVLVTPDGTDANNTTGGTLGNKVAGFGNGFISSYSVEGSVGNFPTASVKVAALNFRTYAAATAQPLPSLDANGNQASGSFYIGTTTAGAAAKPSVLKPGDITVDISTAGSLFNDITGVCVQSFNISADFNREDVNCLGLRVPKSKEAKFPINIQFSTEVLANDLVDYNLLDFLCVTGKYDASVTLRQPNCSGSGSIAAKYILKGLSLEGESWNTTNGGSETKSIKWIGQIGASNDLVNGLFFSGISSY
jgi:hypothetical protein